MLRRFDATKFMFSLALSLALLGCTSSREASRNAGSERTAEPTTTTPASGAGALPAEATPTRHEMHVIDGGGMHTIALDSSGQVWMWGHIFRDELQEPGIVTEWRSPVRITSSGMTHVVAVAAGHAHSVALDAEGHVWAWGFNADSQLGDGTTTRGSTPIPVSTSSGLTHAVAVAAGGAHSVALDEEGHAWTWGRVDYVLLQSVDGPFLGTESDVPVRVAPASGMGTLVAIAAGEDHTIALDEEGHVFGWGANRLGQLGDTTSTDRDSPVPVSRSSGMGTIVAVAAGGRHTIALDEEGHVWTWGLNDSGQLGTGERGPGTDRHVPVRVVSTSGMGAVVAIAAGGHHSVALDEEGHVWTWGWNLYGALGVGTSGSGTHSNVPVRAGAASGMGTVVAIACGLDYTLAVDSAGYVWGWGWNIRFQLSIGVAHQVQDTPVPIPGLRLIVPCHPALPSCEVGAHPPTCAIAVADDGTPCDDGDPSTSGDVCTRGVCGGVREPSPAPSAQ